MKENTFYKDKNFEYPEIAILMDDNINIDNPTGRFIIPILTPNFNNERLIQTEKIKSDLSNVINRNNNMVVTSVVEQNFVTLTIPKYMLNNIVYNKGDKFIVVFIGGNVNKIRIIGVY